MIYLMMNLMMLRTMHLMVLELAVESRAPTL
jgi:hypothetical protein